MVKKKKKSKSKPKGNWSNDQFKQSNGRRGSKEKWSKAASQLLKRQGKESEHLEALGLTEVPESLAALKRAYRKAMLTAHPDVGGTEEEAAMVNEAYEALTEILKEAK